jgi:hypothetical protein
MATLTEQSQAAGDEEDVDELELERDSREVDVDPARHVGLDWGKLATLRHSLVKQCCTENRSHDSGGRLGEREGEKRDDQRGRLRHKLVAGALR